MTNDFARCAGLVMVRERTSSSGESTMFLAERISGKREKQNMVYAIDKGTV